MTSTIPLSSLSAHYPPFLSTPSGEPNVLTTEPAPERLRDLSRFSEEHRAALADAVAADLRRWNAPPGAFASIERLRQADAYAVVTGQQAGIATGPLYTLVKAAGAVAAAETLSRRFPGKSFIPVFWIEADDHDFDEARTITLPERDGDPRTLRYDDGDGRRLHVGDRRVNTERLKEFLNEARQILGETDFTDDLFNRIEAAYTKGDATLADGFAALMYAFLGDTSLVLLSSRNPGLKRLAADAFAAEAANPDRLHGALRMRTDELAENGLPAPIEPKPGALFYTFEGERRSLDIDGDDYVVRGTDLRMTRDEAAGEARAHPERFSPNVALRPIVQDAVLPTAMYLGGPSEFAYMRQLRDAYPLFGMEQPAIAPRPFVTLVEPKVARGIESSGIELSMLFDPEFDPAAMLIDNEMAEQLSQALERSRATLLDAFAGLEAITEEIDRSLANTLGASGRKAEKELENFGGRLHAALRRKNETGVTRLESVRSLILPGGKLQERSVCPLYYANKYGIDGLRKTLSRIVVAPGLMQVIPIAD